MSIGIIGYGFVGQAVASAYIDPYDITIYDPIKYPHISLNYLVKKKPDCCFICAPTPMLESGEIDASIVCDILTELADNEYYGLVVIKSTCLWSYISKFKDDLRLVVNPEFLTQNNSVEDFKNQNNIVIGCSDILDAKVLERIYTNGFNLPNLTNFIHCTEQEAVDIKYIHNIYHAYKVLFWNFVQETTGNERKIFSAYAKIRGTTEAAEMARLCADGRPGYGGACFIKDVGAHNVHHPHLLTNMMIEFNKQLRDNKP